MDELDALGFEASVLVNGAPYWSARVLCEKLGYADYKTFTRVIDRAIKTCASLNIPTLDNFRQVTEEVDGRIVETIKLSRFA